MITTPHSHGFKAGDKIAVNGEVFTVTRVTDSAFTIGPVRWYVRLWQWIKRLFT